VEYEEGLESFVCNPPVGECVVVFLVVDEFSNIQVVLARLWCECVVFEEWSEVRAHLSSSLLCSYLAFGEEVIGVVTAILDSTFGEVGYAFCLSFCVKD